MNPALSVVFFSTLSGAGLGLLAWLGLAYLRAPLPLSREIAAIPFAVGLALLLAGLLASLWHLGQPQRAWRALSQWRSSWLSREGVLAVAVFPATLGLMALIWIEPHGGATRAAAALLALLALATVVSTAKIYDTLATISAWCTWHVLPSFLLFAGITGALWFWTLLALAGWQLPRPAALGLAAAAAALGVLKLGYWRHVDRARPRADAGSATGLGSFGRVRPFEAPHTEQNYLLREMGFVLARRHARRLRGLAWTGFALLPAMAAAFAWHATAGEGAVAAAALAAATLGTFVERWLFFAEARHAVTVYYRSDDGA